MNNRIFGSSTRQLQPTDTVNEAGGKAYKLESRHALAQLAVTGVISNTYYASAENQLTKVIELCKEVDSRFISRLAIYARREGVMKDMPAILLAYLSTRPEKQLFHETFDAVADNLGTVRNFVQVIRSGVLGRKSLGSAPKKAIQRWFNNHDAEKIFWQSFGTNPSPADVIKLAHPKPKTVSHSALFAWLMDKPYTFESLPQQIQNFEQFKKTTKSENILREVPDVPWGRLTSLDLSKSEWKSVFMKMTWNQLRSNINNALRKGLLDDPQFVQHIATTLRDKNRVQKSRVLPFAILTSINALEASVPPAIVNAMQDALELSFDNLPVFDGHVEILVDTSGSMQSPVSGQRNFTAPRGTFQGNRCVDVASVFASAVLKANPDNCTVTAFDTRVYPALLNARDSLKTNTSKLAALGGGGTDIASGLANINQRKSKPNLVIIISDNESWFDGQTSRSSPWYGMQQSTGANLQWHELKKRCPDAKLVCWNIQPYVTTQVPDDKNVLNIGGLSESVFEIIKHFASVKDAAHWTSIIEHYEP